MSQFSVAPLVAVGAEGFFGIVSILIAMPFLALLKDRSDYFDLARGWRQITGNNIVLYSSFAIMLSIAMFNAFGLSVTRYVSATARSTTDTCRTLGIWVVSLYLGWEVLMWPFSALQVFGFGLLVLVSRILVTTLSLTYYIDMEPSCSTTLLLCPSSYVPPQSRSATKIPKRLVRSSLNIISRKLPCFPPTLAVRVSMSSPHPLVNFLLSPWFLHSCTVHNT